jgi:CheY-like chemotaxis protein
VWARTVQEAIEALETIEFRAVLLDQFLPMDDPLTDRANLWQGSLLLHWLRGHAFPGQAPAIAIEEWKAFAGRAPLDANRRVHVIIVSAYFDAEVDAAMRTIEPDLSLMQKPLDATKLVQALNSSPEE